MALHLCKNADGTGIVSEQNPLQTKHTNSGEPVTVAAYIFNDGKRYQMENDQNPPPLVYTNLQVAIRGVSHSLEQRLEPSTSQTTISLDRVDGWNSGTIIQANGERMRVEQILTSSSILVQRNYTADGKPSTIKGHNIGDVFVSETTAVSLALPSITDENEAGTFLNGGEALANGVDSTYLTNSIDALDTTNVITSSKASKYHVGGWIKINNEIMKITAINGNNITVIRGWDDSRRQAHSANSIIYAYGIVDVSPITHKIFIKNDPPAGLPTQIKKDVIISVTGDELPVV